MAAEQDQIGAFCGSDARNIRRWIGRGEAE
jgi:hypothetical protein